MTSFEWFNAVVDDPHLSADQKRVAMVLFRHMKPDGSGASPSLATIRRKARMRRNTASAALLRLESDGWLIRVSVARGTVPSSWMAAIPSTPDPFAELLIHRQDMDSGTTGDTASGASGTTGDTASDLTGTTGDTAIQDMEKVIHREPLAVPQGTRQSNNNHRQDMDSSVRSGTTKAGNKRLVVPQGTHITSKRSIYLSKTTSNGDARDPDGDDYQDPEPTNGDRRPTDWQRALAIAEDRGAHNPTKYAERILANGDLPPWQPPGPGWTIHDDPPIEKATPTQAAEALAQLNPQLRPKRLDTG